MNPKPTTSIRALGQRSIASSFSARSSNLYFGSADSKEDNRVEASKKSLRASLVDFLDRRLHTTSELPRTVQGKSRPFLSPLGPGESNGSIASIDGHFGAKKGGEANSNCVINKVLFEQFKHNGEDKGDRESSCSDVGCYNIDVVPESRKRRNPFQGGYKKYTARKHLLALGDEPEPKRKAEEERLISKKKSRPLYNHYANGRGWWDCNMEGVDNEEVGFNEVWEGVGSTTLGGIEWH